MEKIIERDYVGQLTKAQALALSNIYINTIRKELRYQVDHFLKYEFHEFKQIKTPEAMQNFVFGKYRYCVREVREQFSSFKLKGGPDFVFAIEAVSEKNTAASRQQIIKILSNAYTEPSPDTELIKSQILSAIQTANESGEKDLREYIHQMY
ncbi:MAG: hypothetical protein ACMG51_08020 [Ginsengibacter sp.]